MGTDREPRTVDEWKAAYFRMMELRDAAVAGVADAVAQAVKERDDYWQKWIDEFNRTLQIKVGEMANLTAYLAATEAERMRAHEKAHALEEERDARTEEVGRLMMAGNTQADQIATLKASLEQARHALSRSVALHYDTHGWFFCSWCGATSPAKTVAVPVEQQELGQPVGYLGPADDPFPHQADCSYLAILAALASPPGGQG